MKNVIIDYGLGNLRSVQKSFLKAGQDSIISGEANAIKSADRLILPGVGAFKDAITQLNSRNLTDIIKEFLVTERPIFGICLGMQLLYKKSYEDGEHEGLGLIDGEVKKFVGQEKVPHMGWNEVISIKNILTKNLTNPYVYFVHSYFAPINYATESKTRYCEMEFSASVAYQNIYGTQFHPEKSGDVGLEILKNFFKI